MEDERVFHKSVLRKIKYQNAKMVYLSGTDGPLSLLDGTKGGTGDDDPSELTSDRWRTRETMSYSLVGGVGVCRSWSGCCLISAVIIL